MYRYIYIYIHVHMHVERSHDQQSAEPKTKSAVDFLLGSKYPDTEYIPGNTATHHAHYIPHAGVLWTLAFLPLVTVLP